MSFDEVVKAELREFRTGFNPFGTGQCLSTNSLKENSKENLSFNPFGTGQCLSTESAVQGLVSVGSFQSLWNRAMSFDRQVAGATTAVVGFQSLWNRAMSFDILELRFQDERWVSIPLEQGNVFRPIKMCRKLLSLLFQSLWNRAMSFDIGRGHMPDCCHYSFNPFGTGQCLSTLDSVEPTLQRVGFQSLWNRAMSFDCSRVFEPCVARLPRTTSQLFLMFE